jgi:hypothetical protein
MSKRAFSALLLAALSCGFIFSLDFSVSPGGFVLIPTGDGNVNANGRGRYEIGGGGFLGAGGNKQDSGRLLVSPGGRGGVPLDSFLYPTRLYGLRKPKGEWKY